MCFISKYFLLNTWVEIIVHHHFFYILIYHTCLFKIYIKVLDSVRKGWSLNVTCCDKFLLLPEALPCNSKNEVRNVPSVSLVLNVRSVSQMATYEVGRTRRLNSRAPFCRTLRNQSFITRSKIV